MAGSACGHRCECRYVPPSATQRGGSSLKPRSKQEAFARVQTLAFGYGFKGSSATFCSTRCRRGPGSCVPKPRLRARRKRAPGALVLLCGPSERSEGTAPAPARGVDVTGHVGAL